MLCAQRRILISDYRQTVRVYADSVGKMTDLVDIGMESEVALLRRLTKNAWEAAEQARLALYRHEANHGCDRPDFVPAARAAGT